MEAATIEVHLPIAGQMPYAMTSNGKYTAEETASMLQNAGAERYEECAAAWPLQSPLLMIGG